MNVSILAMNLQMPKRIADVDPTRFMPLAARPSDLT
jgi:hypothetical protein